MSNIDNIINKIGKNPEIRDFGLYENYEPNTTHKNVVYLATDLRKIYLNGKEYGSGTLDESVLNEFNSKLNNKVDKIDGKLLSTEDFTTELKNRLNSLTNYDDTDIKELIDELVEKLNTLIGTGNVSEVIDTFNEIEDFLNGITNSETLTGLLGDLKKEITDLCASTYLPLSGGTITGAINLTSGSSGTDITKGINQYDGNTIRSHIGFATGLYVYHYGYITLRPEYDFTNPDTTKGLSLRKDSILFNNNKVWHEGNDGAGSGLDADTIDGYQANNFSKYQLLSESTNLNTFKTNAGFVGVPGNAYATNGNNFPTNYAGSLIYCQSAYSQSNQIYGAYHENRWYARAAENGGYTNWREFAFTDSNVASATKLQTSRKILGVAFDGTKDIIGTGEEGLFLKWINGLPTWTNETIESSVSENLYAYGVEWNPNVKDPVLTRVGNLALHKSLPIQSLMKGCVAKYTNDKWEIQYYLNETNWTKKADGTASRLDGYDGEVMVHIPKFYYKSWDKTNIKRVMISQTKIASDWIESPEMLVGAYRSTVLTIVPANMGYLSTLPTNSAVSIVNTNTYCRGGNNSATNDSYLSTDKFRTQLGKPRTALSRANMRIYSRNGNKEMLSYDQYKMVFYWLYVIEYANFNSLATFNDALTSEGYKQGGLGAGVTTISDEYWSRYNGYYPLIPCGYCNELGNGTGIKSATLPSILVTTNATTSINYTRNTYTETIDGIPYSRNAWEYTTANGIMTITKVNSNTVSGIYTSRLNQSGSTVYKVEGLQSGQSLIFYKTNTNNIVGTASSNGNITIDWGSGSETRYIKASFVGDCNIKLSIVSASTATYTLNGYTLQVPRWRGFDNPFGDIWTNLDGIIIKGNEPSYATSNVYTTKDSSKYGDSASHLELMELVGTEINLNGYTKTFNLGSSAEIIPSEVGGSSTTYKCDYHYLTKDSTLRTLLVGGGANNGAFAGLSYFYSSYGVSSSYAHFGFRSVVSSSSSFSFLSD